MRLSRKRGIILKKVQALAGMAQWTECWSENQRVAGSIPSQGTCLGCRPGPQLGVCERQPIDVSLHFSLPSLLSVHQDWQSNKFSSQPIWQLIVVSGRLKDPLLPTVIHSSWFCPLGRGSSFSGGRDIGEDAILWVSEAFRVHFLLICVQGHKDGLENRRAIARLGVS